MTTETPPTWAIEEALKRAGIAGWSLADVLEDPSSIVPKAILAMAALIAKYEQPPVDPVALLLADYYDELNCPEIARHIRAGDEDGQQLSITALRTALEKHGMLK